jgi:peptide/nickel transport system substrate-binding protein
VASVLLTACTSSDDSPDLPSDVGANQASGDKVPGSFAESPMLTDMVEAGELPPVDERLPVEPYVVRPGVLVPDDALDLEIGQFGGVLETAREPTGDAVLLVGLNEPLLWAPGGFRLEEGIEGNVLNDWSANEDSTVFTFHMREGLRWSDGEPVTMEDVTFAIEDVLLNEHLTPAIPQFLRSGNAADGAPFEFEVVDEWTFTISFDRPYGSFPGQLVISNFRNYEPFLKPRHYLEQFHQEYADPDELSALLGNDGLSDGDWAILFNSRTLNAGNPSGQTNTIAEQSGIGHPTLAPWVLVRATEELFTYERNPYYFKVDEAGNQLPYIDEIRSVVVQDFETMTSRALFGEFDYLGERAAFRTFPLMREREDDGLIEVLTPLQHAAPLTVLLNMTNTEEPWNEYVNDQRFREALNYGINRQEVIDDFYFGQFADLPSLSTSGTYDPETANQLLDAVGLDATDSDGCRLAPDGERFTFLFELAEWTEAHMPVAELVTEHWRDIGICVTPRSIGDLGERLFDNSLQANLMFDHLPGWSVAQWDDYLPVFHSVPWREWHTSLGEAGSEPPDEMKALFELHEQLLAASFGSDEARAAYEGILENHRDNVWSLQIVQDARLPTFVTSRVRNVPNGLDVDVHAIIVTYSMEQWYLDE